MDVELSKLLSVHPELVNDPLLSEYKHYLERMVRRIPHVLSEAEEKLIISKPWRPDEVDLADWKIEIYDTYRE